MKVERTASGKFRISEGDYFLDLNQTSYEDLYYALPLDPPTLFLLLNETVLSRKDDRDTLKKIVAVHGNMQQAMPLLGREIAKCDPKAAAPAPAEPIAPVAPVAGEGRSSLSALVEEVVTRKSSSPERAAVPPPVPSARPPGKGKTRGTKKSKVRKAAPADDDIPVAEVVTPAPAGRLVAPPLPPVAPVIAKGEAPAPQKKPTLGVLRTPEVEFLITDGETVIKLSQKRYEELYRALPLDNATLYRFLNDSVLTSPQERERFQEMVRRAGGTEAALGALVQQIKLLPPDPTSSFPARRPSSAQAPAVPAPPARPAAPALPAGPAASLVPAGAQPVPPVKKPSSYVTPTPPSRTQPPSAAAKPPLKPGIKFLDMEVETVAGEKFRIIYGNLMLTLAKAEYQELYYSLPCDNVSLFRLLFTKLLPDAESKGTLKKMVEKAGSHKLFFDSLQTRVREVAPAQQWD